MNPLEEALTLKEASDTWNVSQGTLKQKCLGKVKGDKAFTNTECRKSGGTWLITRSAMVRLYGEPK